MKIYDRAGFPNPSRIRIALAEKGLESQVEFVSVDLIAAEHKQAPFLRLNPLGTIPVLELDDGTYLSECVAITEYLDHLDGNPVLTGKTPKERAVIHMMQRRVDAELLDPVGHYFHHATPGLGDDLFRYKSPEWEHRKSWGAREGQRAVNAMTYLNNVLENQAYVAGDKFSMADISVFAALNFADAAGLAPSTPLNALNEWRDRTGERASVKNRTGQMFVAEDLLRLGF